MKRRYVARLALAAALAAGGGTASTESDALAFAEPLAHDDPARLKGLECRP